MNNCIAYQGVTYIRGTPIREYFLMSNGEYTKYLEAQAMLMLLDIRHQSMDIVL